MTMQHLRPEQNLEISRLLIGAGKAIFIASMLALLFPQLGQPRPVLFAVLGSILSLILVTIGVMLIKGGPGAPREKERRR
jgi:hypothetical protein